VSALQSTAYSSAHSDNEFVVELNSIEKYLGNAVWQLDAINLLVPITTLFEIMKHFCFEAAI